MAHLVRASASPAGSQAAVPRHERHPIGRRRRARWRAAAGSRLAEVNAARSLDSRLCCRPTIRSRRDQPAGQLVGRLPADTTAVGQSE
jgi:hypothetical protein